MVALEYLGSPGSQVLDPKLGPDCIAQQPTNAYSKQMQYHPALCEQVDKDLSMFRDEAMVIYTNLEEKINELGTEDLQIIVSK